MKKRFVSLLLVFSFIFSVVVGRCAYVAFSGAYQVSDTYNSYSLEIGTLKPYIFDRRGNALNNISSTYVAVIRPNEKCLSELGVLFDASEIAKITQELSKGFPIIKEVSEKKETKYIQIFKRINQNSDDMVCRHLLDYRCGGLESYLPDEIGSLSINFPVDAMGRLLAGNDGEIINDDYDSKDGAIISIDGKIQKICEESAETIKKGAVVVMDSQSSQILACVSRGGDYNNRAIAPYAVGSVFKLIVCAAALENGINPVYNCTSSIKVYDTEFSCQNKRAHGLQNMRGALAYSCNCFFVNLALELGADKLYSAAKAFGFGNPYNLYTGWVLQAGHFPEIAALRSAGQLALIGFGQGQLTDSPVHFAAAVSCIANGGNYSEPGIMLSDVKENKIISEATAKKIREYMHYVVTKGTGREADYKGKTAGKTATAQSGIYKNNKEILNTWFSGFYPLDNPKYTIVVMCEDGESGSKDCCPVFRNIVEKIENL